MPRLQDRARCELAVVRERGGGARDEDVCAEGRGSSVLVERAAEQRRRTIDARPGEPCVHDRAADVQLVSTAPEDATSEGRAHMMSRKSLISSSEAQRYAL